MDAAATPATITAIGKEYVGVGRASLTRAAEGILKLVRCCVQVVEDMNVGACLLGCAHHAVASQDALLAIYRRCVDNRDHSVSSLRCVVCWAGLGCCVTLCCIALCCVVLRCVVVLSHAVLCYVMFRCAKMRFVWVCCVALHCLSLHCIVL